MLRAGAPPARRVAGRSFRPRLVLNGDMKRIPLGVALAVCLLGAAASTASAKTYELGASTDAAHRQLPGQLLRRDAYDGAAGPHRRRSDIRRPSRSSGRIVAFTLQLGSLSDRQIHFFNSTYGGTSRVQLTVLREQARPTRSYEVVATTGIFKVQPYFGTTVQFPLKTTLAAQQGRRRRADGADVGAGAGRQPAAGERLAREPRRQLHRPADADGADDARQRHAVQVPLPDGARDLHGDADHDAGRAETAG